MNTHLRKLAVIILILVFARTVKADEHPAAAGGQPGRTAPPIEIGAILPLTGDGSFWGTNPRNGIELALKDLTESSANPFRIIFEDDRCDPKTAVAAYKKLVEVNKVKIILGPACSSATLAVAPLAQKDGVILLSFSEADSISDAGDNIFRLWVPNGRQGRKLAQHLIGSAKVKRVAVISIQNAFGADIVAAFKKEFEQLGGTIVVQEDYDPGSRDFRTQLLRIKAAKPEALFFASYIADGAIILRQAKESNAAPRYFSGSTINSPDFFKQLGPAADGLVFADVKDETTEQFRRRYSAEFSQTWPGMQSGAPLFYDIVRILALIEYSNDAADARQALVSLRDYRGVSGPVSFDSSGDLERSHLMFTVKNGEAASLD